MNKCYLHFTNIRSLLYILESKSIRFGLVSRSNDEIEKRIRLISLKDMDSIGNNIEKYAEIKSELDEIIDNELRVFCVTEKDNEDIVNDKDFVFTLPSMWDHYAQKNRGVCIIFKKSAFSESMPDYVYRTKIKYIEDPSMYIDTIREGTKGWVDFSKLFDTSFDRSQYLHHALNDLLLSDKHPYRYKFANWITENETRFICLSKDEVYVNIMNSIDSIILGTKSVDTIVKLYEFGRLSKIEGFEDKFKELFMKVSWQPGMDSMGLVRKLNFESPNMF